MQRVRITDCRHGTHHVSLGKFTLHLTPYELLLMGQAINQWVHKHPSILQQLGPEDRDVLDPSLNH